MRDVDIMHREEIQNTELGKGNPDACSVHDYEKGHGDDSRTLQERQQRGGEMGVGLGEWC